MTFLIIMKPYANPIDPINSKLQVPLRCTTTKARNILLSRNALVFQSGLRTAPECVWNIQCKIHEKKWPNSLYYCGICRDGGIVTLRFAVNSKWIVVSSNNFKSIAWIIYLTYYFNKNEHFCHDPTKLHNLLNIVSRHLWMSHIGSKWSESTFE